MTAGIDRRHLEACGNNLTPHPGPLPVERRGSRGDALGEFHMFGRVRVRLIEIRNALRHGRKHQRFTTRCARPLPMNRSAGVLAGFGPRHAKSRRGRRRSGSVQGFKVQNKLRRVLSPQRGEGRGEGCESRQHDSDSIASSTQDFAAHSFIQSLHSPSSI